jgi:hypothetical protein
MREGVPYSSDAMDVFALCRCDESKRAGNKRSAVKGPERRAQFVKDCPTFFFQKSGDESRVYRFAQGMVYVGHRNECAGAVATLLEFLLPFGKLV